MDLSNSPIVERGKTSIVIPVLNESGNIRELINGIMRLKGNKYFSKICEIIFVDDGSTDGTQALIRSYSSEPNPIPIILLERNIKNGTVNAQLFGISHTRSEAVIVMDGDLQHPAEYIPILIEKYLEGYDLVLASRYTKEGRAERIPIHGIVSRGANYLAKFMLPWVNGIKDPISGYFIVSKRVLVNDQNCRGFSKLALKILSSGRKITVSEVPFHFKERMVGESKVATGGTSFLLKYLSELLNYRRTYKEQSARNVLSRTIPEVQTYK